MSFLAERIIDTAIVTKLAPETTSLDPLPVLVPEILPKYHQDLHLRSKGTMPPLNIYEFKNCVVGPHGSIISQAMEVQAAPDIIGSQWTRDRLMDTINGWSESDPLIRALSGKSDVIDDPSEDPVFVLNRPGCFVYGHWLLDILPMIFLFLYSDLVSGDICDLPDLDRSRVRFLLPEGVPPWATSFMNMLFGIPKDRVITYPEQSSVFKSSRLVVASQMRYSDFCSKTMNIYVDFIKSRMLKYASQDELPKNIFVTRKAINSAVPRSVHNENVLVGLAGKLGLQEIDVTSLAWPDQIRLFCGAKIICGPFGSGMHNSMFSDRNAICFSLGSSRMNWIQSGISALRQQRMAYLLPIYEDFRDGRNIMIYDTERFCHGLSSLVKISSGLDV